MIFKVLAFAFAGITALSVVGAWFKRNKRVPFIWAAFSAGVAALAAYSQVFWPVALFGLMALWALFTTTDALSMAWRVKVGLSGLLALASLVSIYPTLHDEVLCSEKRATTPASCPAKLSAMEPDAREAFAKAAARGDKGIGQFLLHNLPFRLARGLDLKGGLRLVYTVDVEEAIKDKRDRYYDSLRASLTKAYGLSTKDSPSVDEMKKLGDHVAMHRPRDRVDTIVVRFKSADEAKKHVNDKFLGPFLGELTVLRSADGQSITFSIQNLVAADIRNKAVTQAKETIDRRVNELGLKDAQLSSRDEDIIVEIAGGKDSDFKRIRDIISETARLEFKLLADDVNFFEKYASAQESTLPKGLRFEIENAPLGKLESGGTRTQPNYYARLNKIGSERLEDTLKRFREWTATLELPEDNEIGFGKIYEVNPDTEQYEAVGWRTYYLRAKAELTGDMVRDAQARADSSDTGMGGWFVNMTLTPLGGEIFEKITGDNVKKRFAIILDGKVESAPVIQEAIGGGTARITMGAGGLQQQLEDSRKLELVLRSGALPAPISPSNEQHIGPSLGNDAIDMGMRAAGVGSILVLALIFAIYRQAGLVANIAVLFNLVLQLSVLAMFSASMTLPGVAALALTVGMAVDANVLINERIKEELRNGKSARAAIATGYEKAFSAILDGNATTLIAGLILAQYGTGPIKGFANTLIIGMLTNLFTGVVVTRLLFEFWVRGRRKVELRIGMAPGGGAA